MTYFFQEDIKKISSYKGHEIEFYNEHIVSMRPKEGEELTLTDLQGFVAQVIFNSFDKKRKIVSAKIMNSEFIERADYKPVPNWGKILFQAQVDKNYMEKMFQILPFTLFSEVYIFASDYTQKQSVNLERLDKILISSCEQAHLIWKPQIKLLTFNEAIEMINEHKPVVLDCIPDNQVDTAVTKKGNNAYLIGPEGGWSQKERGLFESFGLDFLYLGSVVYPAWIAPIFVK
jgi:RsmE family RNA methyltransferase